MTDTTIRKATPADVPEYLSLVQRTSQAAYPIPELGFTANLISPESFKVPRIHDYFASNLSSEPGKHAWVAVKDGKLIGAIGVIEHGDSCELKGFYVDPAHQNQGLGSRLWRLALEVIGGREVILDTYEHNEPTISMYKHWGFEIDARQPKFPDTWPGLPEDHKVIGINMRRPSLAENLARTEAIKREMTELLRELEEKSTGKPVKQPGSWRHHPAEWAEENPPT